MTHPKYCAYLLQSYDSYSHEVNEARLRLLSFIQDQSLEHSFPSLTRAQLKLQDVEVNNVPEVQLNKDEEKSPPPRRCTVKESSNFLLHVEEMKPEDALEQHGAQSRIYSASAMHLLEQLEPIPAIRTESQESVLRAFSSKQLDFKFMSIVFKPENKVLVGHQKLRKQLKRTKSAQAAFQSKEMLSAFEKTIIQEDSSILSTSFNQEIEQVDQILSSRQRCRRGLAFLHNYFKPPHKVTSLKTQVSNMSQNITIASSKQDSSNSVLKRKKISESSTSTKSDSTFSSAYYKHLSSMLSCFIENEQEEIEDNAIRSREIELFVEQNDFQQWYVCDLEEFQLNGEIILDYTRKLKRSEEEQYLN